MSKIILYLLLLLLTCYLAHRRVSVDGSSPCESNYYYCPESRQLCTWSAWLPPLLGTSSF